MSATLWVCLRLKAPSLAAVRRRLAEPSPWLAITDGPGNRPQVIACTKAAAQAGVRPGLSVPAARALCAQLVTTPRDANAEQDLRELLGAWAYGFSDQVTLALPDAVTFEVGGSLRLFRGWPQLERQLRSDLDTLGFEATLAVAPRPRAAWVFAGRGEALAIERDDAVARVLDDLPITQIGLDDSAAAALRTMGFLRVRELLAVPRDSLGRRAGVAVPTHLDRLYGRAPDPLPGWRPPDTFESAIEFDARPTSVEPLLFALRRLINELAAVLHARDGGVQQFRLVLMHEDVPATSVRVGLLRPERDPARLLDLARARFERVELPAAISGLAIVANDLPAFRPTERDLFSQAQHEATDWPLLQERLRARLGDDAVRMPVERADHRPERASDLVDVPAGATTGPRTPRASRAARPSQVHVDGHTREQATEANPALPPRKHTASPVDAASPDLPLRKVTKDHPASAAQPQAGAPRPIWLLPRPIPLRGTPARILSGPERIETGWWDGGDMRRDYYIVETDQGQRAWAYCAAGHQDGWMLHGWFA